MKRILLASGQNAIDKAVGKFDGFEPVGVAEYKNELMDKCLEIRPDVLIVGEGLGGQESLVGILLNLVKELPNMRIVYLSGYVDIRDEAKVNSLGLLVMAGINDINHDKTITVQTLKNLMENPKTAEQMGYLTKKVKLNTNNKENEIVFEIPEEDNSTTEEDDIYNNLHVVSSIKPGTGKSFLSTNIATAIANYGVETADGKKPRVAIIEADLQNLSVGTLLQIENDNKNLKTVMDKIGTIISKEGEFFGNIEDTEKVNSYIKSCFSPYYRVKNLEALVGSQLTFDEIEDIKPYHYIYLIDAIAKDFDVIIIDSNSSLTHVTTYPLLHMAKSCYYVLNLDFNNVRNNLRYKDMLREMGIAHKVKYVLNEDIVNKDDVAQASGTDIEELIFTADHLDDSQLNLEARIPLLPKTVFLNRLYEGTPVILDDMDYTLKARYELMKVANQIWPIKNFKDIEEEVEKMNGKKKKRMFF